jgi:hypothetical protein
MVDQEQAPVLSAADHAFWQEHGYLVIDDVVPQEVCTAVQSDILAYLGLDGNAPVADHYDKVLPDDRGGFVNLTQSQGLWDARQSPRLHQAFAEVYDSHKLWVSMDQAHMKLPYRQVIDEDGTSHTWGNGGIYFGAEDERNDIGGLHWDVHGGGDQDPEMVERKNKGEPTGGLWAGAGLPSMLEFGDGYPCGPQGVLYLNDRDEEGGGFRCVPGFHRRFNDWLATLPRDRSLEQADAGNWIATHPDLQGLLAEARTIPAKAGSIVIWHRLLPHSNGRNLSDSPRFAQYITMSAVPTDPDEFAEQSKARVDMWQKRGDGWRAPLSEDPRQARWQQWEMSSPPAQLTSLGRRLIGAVPWD